MGRNSWNYADLKDMAKQAGFPNVEFVGSFAIESANLDTPLCERDCHHYDISSEYREDFPYRKTLSGGL